MMSPSQLEALRLLMNAQRSYLLAAQMNPEHLPEAIEKMWEITNILDKGFDLHLDSAASIAKQDIEVNELYRLFGL